jgi:hypothetical protein
MSNSETALEFAYVKLWRRVERLKVELDRGSNIQCLRQALEQALDEALVDYTHWQRSGE